MKNKFKFPKEFILDDRPIDELTDEEKNERSMMMSGKPYKPPTPEEIEEAKKELSELLGRNID
jgi:hypothetical protein